MIKRDFIISIICLSLGLVLLFRKEDATPLTPFLQSTSTTDSVKKYEAKILYGMAVDTMTVVEQKIKPNQNLSQILSLYNVPFDIIHKVAEKSREIFDLRKITTNRKYALFCSKDSTKAHYFVYEPNEFEYVVCHLNDPSSISRHVRKTDTVTNAISGIIENSLFESMTKSGAKPEFAYQLAEVFKWQIDFHKIQNGDKFKVLFEEILVEGEPIGAYKILGAFFNHQGENFYAVGFDQGNGLEYFDNNGKNLQKAFLKAPLKFSRISSRYTLRRFHPVTKAFKAHLGTDYAAPRGTPIQTVGDGIVLEARYTSANGNYVKVKHDKTNTTQYLHMSKIASGIRAGKRVKQGETLGYVGSTGLATGPHLCYRFWQNGKQVDALKVKIPPTEPVKQEYKEAYDQTKIAIIEKLNSLSYEKGYYLASSN